MADEKDEYLQLCERIAEVLVEAKQQGFRVLVVALDRGVDPASGSHGRASISASTDAKDQLAGLIHAGCIMTAAILDGSPMGTLTEIDESDPAASIEIGMAMEAKRGAKLN